MKFLEEENRFLCFNDWKNLAVMVRLAPGGSVKVIAGHDGVTWASFETKFGQTRARDAFSRS